MYCRCSVYWWKVQIITRDDLHIFARENQLHTAFMCRTSGSRWAEQHVIIIIIIACVSVVPPEKTCNYCRFSAASLALYE